MNTSKRIISLLMCMLMVLTMVPMSVFAESEKTLIKVEVTQNPYKTYYGVGDDFDPTGMIITATYDDGTTADVTDKVVLYDHIDMPLGGTNNIYSVTASYTENGHTENCLIIIKVREYARYLTSIEITKNPDKMTYTEGEYFDPTGMEVTAYYDEGSSEVITGYTYNTEALTTAAPVVLITYAENGIEQGNVLNITVNEAEVLPIDAISVNFTLPSAGDEITEPVYTIPADAKYYCGGAVWREETGKYNVTGSFEAGETYSAVFLIYPNTGESFADSTMITLTANNGDLTGTVAKDGSSMKVVVPFTIPDDPVIPPAEITGITITPATAEVEKGESISFNADVTGTGAFNNAVEWSVSGGNDSAISTDGQLTVGAHEEAEILTVTATAVGDTTKTATATVTVKTVEVPPIDAISVNFTLPSAGDDPTEPVYTIPADAKYYCGGAVWREETGKYNITGSFEAGETYSAVFLIYPNTGESFADPTMITVTANNGDLTGTVAKDGSSMKVVVPFTIPDSGVVTPPHEHTYATEWSKDETHHWNAASCEHTDLKINYEKHQYGSEGICKCGDVCEHDWSLGKVTKPATCKETGIKTYYCLVVGCGSSYTETISVDKNAHPSGSIIILPAKESTCAATGLTSGEKCTHCGVETIPQIETPKLDHEYDNDCDAECNLCTEIRTAPHAYDNACDAECNNCSATRTPAAHKGGTATCKAKAKCSVCGEAYGSLKAHTYSNVTTKATLTKNGKVESKCSVCGNVSKTTTVYYPKTIKLSKTAYTYNGKVQTPSVTVKDSKGNTLKKDTDYTVKYESGRKSPGKYTVTITFKGKYEGTKKLTYTIAPKKVTKLSASQTTTTITLKWSKVTGADGYRVYKYNSKTKKYEKLKDVTKNTLKISKLKAGTAYKYKVRAITKDDGSIYGAYSDVFATATKCKTPSISKLTSSKKGVASLTWTNVSGESGYQVYYSTKKDSGYKKVASYKTNVVKGSKTKLKSGKKYYFKVRAYKKTDSGTVYSSWSAVKSVKIK